MIQDIIGIYNGGYRFSFRSPSHQERPLAEILL